jgi:hypothetical protein
LKTSSSRGCALPVPPPPAARGGRILAQATGALLSAGALDVAVGRIGDAVAA